MKRDPVSNAYASAIFELAKERDELDAVLEESRGFLELLGSDELLRHFIRTPSIDSREKSAVLERALKEKVSSTFLDFLCVVVTKGRQAQMTPILEEFETLYDELKGRLHAEATTAVALEDERREALVQVLSEKLDKTVLLDSEVDPDILGGLVLRFGDLVVDGSVRSELRKVANRLRVVKVGSEFIHED